MPEPLSGADALALWERCALKAEISAATWRELYLQTVRDLEATRAAWATCKAVHCCATLIPDEASR